MLADEAIEPHLGNVFRARLATVCLADAMNRRAIMIELISTLRYPRNHAMFSDKHKGCGNPAAVGIDKD